MNEYVLDVVAVRQVWNDFPEPVNGFWSQEFDDLVDDYRLATRYTWRAARREQEALRRAGIEALVLNAI